MIIRKEYKFYAAHRNEHLRDKCRNLHGHRYGITCHFEVQRDGAYSTLFSEFDDKIQPFIESEYDHSILIHVEDPLYATLLAHSEQFGENFRLNRFNVPTTVENLAHKLFTEITRMGFQLACLEVRETDTSVVVYSRRDWFNDHARGISARKGNAITSERRALSVKPEWEGKSADSLLRSGEPVGS